MSRPASPSWRRLAEHVSQGSLQAGWQRVSGLNGVRSSHGTRGCVNCQRCDVECTWCRHRAVDAKDESDDGKTVYLHVFTTMHLRIRQQARKCHQLQSASYSWDAPYLVLLTTQRVLCPELHSEWKNHAHPSARVTIFNFFDYCQCSNNVTWM